MEVPPAEPAVAVPAAPPAPEPFADPAQEARFTAARELFLHPPPLQQKGLVLLVTVVLFVLASASGDAKQTALELGVLVAVIAFHELGHYVAMRVFGYRDVTVFFVPFLGAATSGKKAGVAAWKESLVLLAGPLPGLAVGLLLLAFYRGDNAALKTTTNILLFLNAANLLPINPLDGGQLFRVLLFARSRVTEAAFSVVSSLALAAIGLAIDAWLLALLGVFSLMRVPWKWRMSAVAQTLAPAGLSPEAGALSEAQTRTLFSTTEGLLGPARADRARFTARTMDELLQQATAQSASWPATIALLFVWAGAVAFTLLAAFLAVFLAPPKWERHHLTHGGLSLEAPYKPMVVVNNNQASFGGANGLTTFNAEWGPAGAGDDEAWFTSKLEEGKKDGRSILNEDRGTPGTVRYQYVWGADRTGDVLLKSHAGWRYMVWGEGDAAKLMRFVESVQVAATPVIYMRMEALTGKGPGVGAIGDELCKQRQDTPVCEQALELQKAVNTKACDGALEKYHALVRSVTEPTSEELWALKLYPSRLETACGKN
jgi:Zn-dependent protease